MVREDRPTLIEIVDLKMWFPLRSGFLSTLFGWGRDRYLRAVDGITFDLRRGEILGLAGESGSGKTTTGMTAIRLYEPTSGSIRFEGQDLKDLSPENLRAFRCKAQIIFQDPYGSLNPKFPIFHVIEEPLIIHKIGNNRTEKELRVRQALEQCGLTPAEAFFDKYPHQLSGGQRQRIAITRAMVLQPEFIVADEPVSMLDVSIRAGILNILKSLSQDVGVAILYISHDLSTIRYICHRTAIMYLGRIVEIGPTLSVLENPFHPYSKALISAIPVPDPHYHRERLNIKGEIPNPIDLPPGCRFYTRCENAEKRCSEEEPTLKFVEEGHQVACHQALN